jgi:uncharacterized protein YkwD
MSSVSHGTFGTADQPSRSQEAAVSAKLRTLLVSTVAAALLAPAATASAAEQRPTARPAQQCADADLQPTANNLPRIRAAIQCLHNQLRANRDLPTLKDNGRLRRAALGHSRSMVANRFFAHTTPAGVTMTDRILRAGYVNRNQAWTIGENLAWGTGNLATPRGAISAWLDSPSHRANMLKRSYRELGVGVVLGNPTNGNGGATYTVDFGVRR